MRVEYPDKLRVETLDPAASRAWRSDGALTRKLGDAWLQARRSALARVPSAILPEIWNVLLNPGHEDARLVRMVKTTRAEYDPRLIPVPRRSKHP